MKFLFKILSLLLILLISTNYNASSKENPKAVKKQILNQQTVNGLKLRLVGPALTSGRISDIAVHPEDKSTYYVAVACGGVWKTTNAGTNFFPIFDAQKSFSIGCVTIDPNNPHIVWVGTGENNSQRSVAWGDGVYKSLDGGKSWKQMGLAKSEHIGKIIVDPRNSNVVYVAAQGPLWGPGGDRGLYKTNDGGETWELILKISENTGVTDIAIDPRNPDVVYAASYQRRRHVWTLINGGPESALHKSENGGKTWTKLTNGLPGGYVGRIGIAVSPANPDIVYALVEASEERGGFFRSSDRGASWEKRFNYISASAQYYQEIFCHPHNPDIVYSIDTYTKFTEDGGKTWKNLPLKQRHVDDHALWIDPDDTRHMLIGGDGGVYETFDGGDTWRFFENLPVTQFYRINADNTEPFYYVYGGTQDNNTLGAPSRTIYNAGITNADWLFVVGGDGYKPQFDPNNPDIVYGQWQYGNLVRFDRKSGEMTYIQPQAAKDEELRWNWDTPLIISPHSPTRLYIAANRVFRSDDRGDSWKAISGDITRQIDRNKLKVMGKLWDPEAVAKNASTSLYGNSISLVESPKKEGLIYVGTDDGLIQMTENGGANWSRLDKFPGVPDMTYNSDLLASQHDENVVYAAFNNHKMADFKPYLLRSADKGKTWKSIAGNLPVDGPVWTIAEDHVNPNLLFAGTEFGVFFTTDGGGNWTQLKSGIPPIAVRDLEIQQRENDLIVGTFGRGIYILDDYTPLRHLSDETLNRDAEIFPVKDALMFMENYSKGRSPLGETFFRAENPPFGAVITYYLKEAFKTKKQLRKDKEAEAEKAKLDITYPTFEELKAEDAEEASYLLFKIADKQGNAVRMLKAPATAGINRIVWDLRYPNTSRLSAQSDPTKHSGMPALPGEYNVTLFRAIDGKFEKIAGPVSFVCKPLENVTLPTQDRKALVDFQADMLELQRAAHASDGYAKDLKDRLAIIKNTIQATKGATSRHLEDIRKIELTLSEVFTALDGDESRAKRNENQPPSIGDRLGLAIYGMWRTTSAPTQSNKDNYKILHEQISGVISKLNFITESLLSPLEKELDNLGAPWTPGRLPTLKK